MHTAFVNINKVPTKVHTWGKWIEESFTENETKEIVLMITGNPGITDFYTTFCETIHEKLGLPVWLIGHAGHEEPERSDVIKLPSLKQNHNLYNVDGQIKHKVDFIEQYVPNNVKVHLIGHSMGSYIITHLLKHDSIRSRVSKSYLLFPTLEYIGDTPNGIFYQKLLPGFSTIILALAWFFTILPVLLQRFCIYIYSIITGTPGMHLATIRTMIRPSVLSKIFFLATDEMGVLKERENDSIRANCKQMRFYFGATDGWAPVSYCDKLKADIPEVDAIICQRNFRHEFVRNSSKEVGAMISTWIEESK